MNARTTLVGIALALLANQASATVLAGSADTLPDGGRGALRALEDPALSALRAGKVAQPVPVGAAERAALRSAETRSDDLGALRASGLDLSDRELTIIAIVLGVVIVLILL